MKISKKRNPVKRTSKKRSPVKRTSKKRSPLKRSSKKRNPVKRASKKRSPLKRSFKKRNPVKRASKKITEEIDMKLFHISSHIGELVDWQLAEMSLKEYLKELMKLKQLKSILPKQIVDKTDEYINLIQKMKKIPYASIAPQDIKNLDNNMLKLSENISDFRIKNEI
jgi:hypothetical protein